MSFFDKIEELKKSLEGRVLLPTDEDSEQYTRARRRPFNQDQRQFPCIIVRPKSTSDVSKCVNFYTTHCASMIKLCVACGAHSSRCMLNKSLVIDLHEMDNVKVRVNDSEFGGSVVCVDGGAYLRKVDEALKPHGLGVPYGTYPETGVGGLTLGGGFGWLSKQHGCAVDNLLGAEVVLADGSVVNVRENNEFADLMWGLRGGGGNFGIVTKFIFRAHKLKANIIGGSVVYFTPTVASAKEVLTNFDALQDGLADEVSAVAVLPIGAPVIPTLWAAFSDTATTASQIPDLAKTSGLGGWFKLENSLKPISFHGDLQTITTKVIHSGFIYQTITIIGERGQPLGNEFISELLAFTRSPLPKELKEGVIILFPTGGEMGRADDGTKTCLNAAVRLGRYFAVVECYWKPECGDAGKTAARDWVKIAYALLTKKSHATFTYAPDEIVERKIESAESLTHNTTGTNAGYPPQMYEKLQRLKGKYDGANVFKQNTNILPVK
jgi:FAD/FMN-containing dehydrogenase